MKIELSVNIAKRLKMLDEFSDLGRDELKENVIELVEELLEQYIEDNRTNEGNDNSDDYE
jgi:metal-responsive CopG/Arc/MetJ family transcriptional regulator